MGNKRGRKPKNEKKGYFYEAEEDALVEYLKSNDKEEKDKIFNETLMPAFTKMVESIIRRYNLYPPDEEFKETFDDTISFLMSKISHFNPESGYKAYSYCGTVCKNYLIYKINQFARNQKRNISYEIMSNDINDNINFSYDQHGSKIQMLSEIIKTTSDNISKIIVDKEKNKLNENEVKVGNALINLLDNWEDLFARMGSNKFNKSSILLFLKETTFLNTKEIRDSMKKFKNAYLGIRKNFFDDIYN